MARNASLESDFRGFFQISSDLMLISDPDAVIADLNTAWSTTLGWSHEELVGTSFLDLIHPDDLSSTMLEYHALLESAKETIVVHETRVRCKDGTYRWTDWTAGMMGDSMYAIGRDVTGRKAALASIAESLETTRAIADAALDSIVVIDRELNIVETNTSSEEIHGHASSDRLNHSVLDLIHPDDRENARNTLLRALEDGGVAILNFRIRHADGHYVALEARGRAIRNENGAATRLVFIGRDATESNAARAALTESLAMTRAIFDTAVDGVVMIDRNFDIIESNAAVANMLGVTLEERAQQATMSVIHPDDVSAVRDAAERLFATDEIVTVRYRVQHADGHWVTVEARGRGLVHQDGPTTSAVFIARDMSDSVKAERDLAASLETTRALLEAAPDSIIMIDDDLNILDASPSTLQTYGLSAADRLGASALDVVIAEDRVRVESDLRGFFRVKRSTPFSIRFGAQHSDGHTLTIEARGLVLSDETRGAARAVIVSRDISDTVAAEVALADSVALTSAIFEAAPDSITTIDDQLCFVSSSPGTERMFGIAGAERIGKPVEFIVHPDDQLGYVAALKRLFLSDSDDTITMSLRAHHTNGTWMRIQTRARLLGSIEGQPARAVMVSRDVSEEFAAQEAMKSAKEAAEESNLAKSEFMSRMSHELRTPLNSVLGFSQILQMELDSPDQQELVGHIFKSGTHLLGLIDEVLDISRVESGHMNVSLESVSVDDVVSECVRIMTPLADEAGVALVVRACHGTQVLTDLQRLTQVLLNLMSNAVKFNSAHGSVTIECMGQGDRVRLNVTDTGPGISSVMVDRLFKAFERLDADAKGIQGTGLGLAHSKSLIEAIGGTVGVDSVLGVGSTFWIDVPTTDVPRATVPEPTVRTTNTTVTLTDTTVLYIEDNVANVHLIERLMSNRTTARLVTSLLGSQGIEIAQQQRPALILLDVHLPDIHGFDVLQQLRSDPRTKDIPVVVLSADATDRQTARFLEAGANDYLTKPFDLRRLLEMFEEYLGAATSPSGPHTLS